MDASVGDASVGQPSVGDASVGQPSVGDASAGDASVGDAEERVRGICLGLPEVEERDSHGSPAYFVRGKRGFVHLMVDGHHDAGFPQMWCAAGPGVQQELIAADPERFFRPPYVGHRGWIGVRTDRRVDWTEVAELCEDAYRVTAPTRLIRILDSRAP